MPKEAADDRRLHRRHCVIFSRRLQRVILHNRRQPVGRALRQSLPGLLRRRVLVRHGGLRGGRILWRAIPRCDANRKRADRHQHQYGTESFPSRTVGIGQSQHLKCNCIVSIIRRSQSQEFGVTEVTSWINSLDRQPLAAGCISPRIFLRISPAMSRTATATKLKKQYP